MATFVSWKRGKYSQSMTTCVKKPLTFHLAVYVSVFVFVSISLLGVLCRKRDGRVTPEVLGVLAWVEHDA